MKENGLLCAKIDRYLNLPFFSSSTMTFFRKRKKKGKRPGIHDIVYFVPFYVD